ncbi:NAD-dependent epimerase/dehydratase family protein [Microvirga lotononidis]|uniref:NAD dependent epimerase/dehydratase family protein n=1 Tax=Microvirga lotononidis TaxID=864069 RepID=I4YKV2_9HYPH|nr:NAD(P)-dependent oxidoreductase [Microvirga lotononidis]EIM24594.1 NAD dependent epimerase/dehydratase family protein [Microvirga lotononidis]WQO26609.1 NAD(P)-dependent oxidoreductase [Microvirga lotononidis]
MSSLNPIRSVLVTGAGGNLGRKLIAHLLAQDWCERIVALDRAVPQGAGASDRVEWVAGNLADPSDGQWHAALAGVDSAVHFAAQNPYPDAPWSDACASFDMTLALLAAAARAGLQRIVCSLPPTT